MGHPGSNSERKVDGAVTLVVACPKSIAWRGDVDLLLGVDVLVDDVVVASVRLGNDVSVTISPGRHEVRPRTSMRLLRSVPAAIDAADGEVIRLRLK